MINSKLPKLSTKTAYELPPTIRAGCAVLSCVGVAVNGLLAYKRATQKGGSQAGQKTTTNRPLMIYRCVLHTAGLKFYAPLVTTHLRTQAKLSLEHENARDKGDTMRCAIQVNAHTSSRTCENEEKQDIRHQ
eukprot:317598-Amphidinium_carterae.1